MDIPFKNEKHVSYLRARDPSIFTGNKNDLLRNLRVNLAEEKLVDESIQEEETPNEPVQRNIQIFLRVKGTDSLGDLYELDGNKIHSSLPEGSHANRNIKQGQCVKRSYTFSHIFGPTSTQEEVFNYTVKPKLLDLLNGENSTLMTYGASGSGKTFTIVGTAADPGVIPRALEYLFRSLPQLSECPTVKPNPTGNVSILTKSASELEKNTRDMLLTTFSAMVDKEHIQTYCAMQQRLSCEPVAKVEQYKNVSIAVWVSFAEIYNEQVYDLLAPKPLKGISRTKLQLGKSNEKTYIKNLTNVSVSSGLEAYQILQYGLYHLNYASTAINSHSSRSHCIFSIKLVQALPNNQDEYYMSYFNFCDLAGSERLKKTQNAGDRLKESNNINTSLMVLGRCISCIRDAQLKNENKVIPYRDSKLTMLFQTALSGKEDIAMIVNMNPSAKMIDETAHVLNFSGIAKTIVIRPAKPKKLESKQLEYIDNDLKEENEKLRELVLQLYAEKEQDKVERQENMDDVILGYRNVINQIQETWKNKLKMMEEDYKKKNLLAIENLREELESENTNNRKRFKRESCPPDIQDEDQVIILDSDDDEEPEFVCRCKELNLDISTLQTDITKYKFDQQISESKLHKEIDDLKAANQHLQNELQKSKSECHCEELNIKVNALQDDLSKLKAEKLHLENELQKVIMEKQHLESKSQDESDLIFENELSKDDCQKEIYSSKSEEMEESGKYKMEDQVEEENQYLESKVQVENDLKFENELLKDESQEAIYRLEIVKMEESVKNDMEDQVEGDKLLEESFGASMYSVSGIELSISELNQSI